jgi:YHS domain-containing protein
VSAVRCVICGEPLGDSALRVRYESRIYAFDVLKCKRIFQENPDRYLDATGEVLEEPR